MPTPEPATEWRILLEYRDGSKGWFYAAFLDQDAAACRANAIMDRDEFINLKSATPVKVRITPVEDDHVQ